MIERFFLAAGSWLVFVRRPNGLNNRFLIFSLSLSLTSADISRLIRYIFSLFIFSLLHSDFVYGTGFE